VLISNNLRSYKSCRKTAAEFIKPVHNRSVIVSCSTKPPALIIQPPEIPAFTEICECAYVDNESLQLTHKRLRGHRFIKRWHSPGCGKEVPWESPITPATASSAVTDDRESYELYTGLRGQVSELAIRRASSIAGQSTGSKLEEVKILPFRQPPG